MMFEMTTFLPKLEIDDNIERGIKSYCRSTQALQVT